jgi:hypothetical protein
MMVRAGRLAPTLMCAVLCLRCGGASPSSPGTSTDRLTFTAAPLELSTIRQIVPLGNLNPPGHTLPTDHIYVNNRSGNDPPAPQQAVFAPGDGVVQFILTQGADSKIGIAAGSSIYYLDHVLLDAAVHTGARVTAGQALGLTGTGTYGIDLGVINNELTVPFANSARYPAESLHGDAPLRFFEEPLRTRLYGLVSTTAATRDGRFNYDVPGRLAGNWFVEGLAAADSAGPAGWPQQLAFVYDNYDPTAIRVSIGGTLALIGAFAVQPGATDPKDVSSASGVVSYGLFIAGFQSSGNGPQAGTMIAQMLGDARLRAEVVPGPVAAAAQFTSAARIYVR